MVKVKDRSLGILRLTLQLLIIGYIVGFVLIYQQAYLKVAALWGE